MESEFAVDLKIPPDADLQDQHLHTVLHNPIDDSIIADPEPPQAGQLYLKWFPISFGIKGETFAQGIQDSALYGRVESFEVLRKNQRMNQNGPHRGLMNFQAPFNFLEGKIGFVGSSFLSILSQQAQELVFDPIQQRLHPLVSVNGQQNCPGPVSLLDDNRGTIHDLQDLLRLGA